MADGLSFKISVTGLNRVLKKMDDIEKGIRKVTVKAGEEIADFGVREAQNNFRNAQYDGVNDVEVSKVRTGDGKWNVVASGKAAAFIEYGTGYGRGQYSGEIPPKYDGIWPGPYPNGAYQGDKAGWVFIAKPGTQYTTPSGGPYTPWKQGPNGGWFQSSRYGFTRGNPPNECMLNAKKAMARESVKIAKSVLKRYL